MPIADVDQTAPALLWMFGIDLPGRWNAVAESIAGAFLPSGFLWAGGWVYHRLRHREGLGFGDVKLIAMVGAFLGLRGALSTLVVGSLAGSLLGYAYIKATRRDAATYELPFGTFLGAAALMLALATEIPGVHR